MLASILGAAAPVASHRIEWLGGRLPLQVSAYASLGTDLPREITTSVRCLLWVEDLIVLCETRDGGRHILPGGHRNDGESIVQTAAREVHEETGWLLHPDSVEALGWLHLQNLNDASTTPGLPYPDFCQVVVCGVATDRDGGRDIDWVDVEGYETSSRLVSVAEARTSVSNELFDTVYLDIRLGQQG